ncbi:MAG: hypothetical protein FWH34_08385 [Desulfovibrionaceae bacterium]|nr:hypothetical protein [Desulfovibrionaceae bacterium]
MCDTSGKSPEHNIESLLLTEFSKQKKEGKGVVGIQPVKYCGFRFAMATPLKASDHKKISYIGPGGGGIDILARTSVGSVRLAVIEVKDQYLPSEPPTDALKQAITYAVFILRLLRSKSGCDWWSKDTNSLGEFSHSLKNMRKIQLEKR